MLGQIVLVSFQLGFQFASVKTDKFAFYGEILTEKIQLRVLGCIGCKGIFKSLTQHRLHSELQQRKFSTDNIFGTI